MIFHCAINRCDRWKVEDDVAASASLLAGGCTSSTTCLVLTRFFSRTNIVTARSPEREDLVEPTPIPVRSTRTPCASATCTGNVSALFTKGARSATRSRRMQRLRRTVACERLPEQPPRVRRSRGQRQKRGKGPPPFTVTARLPTTDDRDRADRSTRSRPRSVPPA